MNERIEELDVDSGVKAADIKTLLADFKQANQNKILSNQAKKIANEQINATLKYLCKSNSQIIKTPELKELFLRACKPLIDNPDVKDTPNGKVIERQELVTHLFEKIDALQKDLALILSKQGENFNITGGYAKYLEKNLFDENGNRIENGIENVKDPKSALIDMINSAIKDTEENTQLIKRNAEYLANQLNKDPDLDEIILKHNTSFIRNTGGVPRSIEKIQQSIDSLTTNLKEIQELKQFSKNGYKGAVNSLYNLGVKGFPKGLIHTCLGLARSVSLEPLLSLGKKPSLEELYKASTYIRDKLNDIFNQAGLHSLLDSPDEKQVMRDLIVIFMLSKTDKAQRAHLAQTLSSQNFNRFNAFCDEAVEHEEYYSGTAAEKTLQTGVLTDIQATINSFKHTLWNVMTKPTSATFSYKGELDPNNEAGTIFDEIYSYSQKLISNDIKKYTEKFIKGDSVKFIQTQMNKKIEKSAKTTKFRNINLTMAESFSNVSAKAINGMMTISILENMKKYSNNENTNLKNDINSIQINLPEGKKLSTDYNTALDELTKFVLKTEKNMLNCQKKNRNRSRL